jgi:hypothetical protein
VVVRPCPGQCFTQESACTDSQPSTRAHILPDDRRVGAKRTALHDRVLGQEIEIGHRREHPVDADGARFSPRYRPGPPDDIQIAEGRERRRGGKLGEPFELLPGATLEIGGDQERSAGTPHQVGRERLRHERGSTEDDEAARALLECGPDRLIFVRVSAALAPAERGHDEPADVHDGHAGVTAPSTRGPAAPVAATRLPGWP